MHKLEEDAITPEEMPDTCDPTVADNTCVVLEEKDRAIITEMGKVEPKKKDTKQKVDEEEEKEEDKADVDGTVTSMSSASETLPEEDQDRDHLQGLDPPSGSADEVGDKETSDLDHSPSPGSSRSLSERLRFAVSGKKSASTSPRSSIAPSKGSGPTSPRSPSASSSPSSSSSSSRRNSSSSLSSVSSTSAKEDTSGGSKPPFRVQRPKSPVFPPSLDSPIPESPGKRRQHSKSLRDLPHTPPPSGGRRSADEGDIGELGPVKRRVRDLESDISLLRKDGRPKEVKSNGASFNAQAKLQIEEANRKVEELTKKLAEKDIQITGLMQEGEKLSKQELRLNQTIKKLRSSALDEEKRRIALEKRIVQMEKTNADLTARTNRLIDSEKKSMDVAKTANKASDALNKQVGRLESDLASARANLDRVQRELQGGKKDRERAMAKAGSAKSLEESLDQERKKADKLRQELKDQKNAFQEQEDKNKKLIEQLRASLADTEARLGSREEDLLQDLSRVQGRLEELEMTQDASQRTEDSTARGLVEALESLREQYQSSMTEWDEKEQSYRDQLSKVTEGSGEEKEELERHKGQLVEMDGLLTGLREELAEVHQAHRAVQAELREKTRLEANRDTIVADYEARILEIEEKSRAREQEMKKQLEEERQKRREIEGQMKQEEEDRRSRDTRPGRLILEESTHTGTKSSWGSPTRKEASNGTESVGKGSGDEHAVAALETRLSLLESDNERLKEELVETTVKADKFLKTQEQLEMIIATKHALEEQLQSTEDKLGYKTDQVAELEADIEDMKEVYRKQIGQLISKVEELSKKDRSMVKF
ncbi:MAG: hypothetical protein DHS80DRAFT_31309 [Piptocephalis tieghemiana]|nr:MAG: hypothetical protein DHS80DRAFT_31309 [Piptocephalis tieghemiana]